jgi:cytochrome c biogenesis protein
MKRIVKTDDRPRERGYGDSLFDFFRSLRLTVFLLILLSILSVFGTLISQNASRDAYLERYGEGLYEVLNFFGLFDMYHTWWFSGILLLLVVNLVVCSIQRFPGLWAQITRGIDPAGFDETSARTLPYTERVPFKKASRAALEEAASEGLKHGFGRPARVETESAIVLASERGKLSRLGFPLIHFSIILILVGGLIGSLFGFKGFVNILEGETVNQIALRTKDREIPKALPFSVRCDDFKVSFYDLPGREQRHVKEYVSQLAILENGKEVRKETVRVNHPLHHRGLAFYQSSYGSVNQITLGIQRKDQGGKLLIRGLEGETLPIPNTSAMVRFLQYAPNVHMMGPGAQVAVLRVNQPPRPVWVLKEAPPGGQATDGEFLFSFEGLTTQEYTGLQVARDPGVWVVWVGCSLLIIGLIISFFFSHQRVWVRIPRGAGAEVLLAGSANKNRIGFEKKFQQLTGKVRAKEQ